MDLGKVTFIVALIVQIIVRYPYRNSVKRRAQDRQEQVLLTLLTVGGILIPFMYIFTDWLAFANYDAPQWVVGIGIVVMAVGLWLFWRAHADLGRNWSSTLALRDDHTLVTQGVYRHIRHPMYAGAWLMYIAQVFLLSNWVAGFSGVVAFGLLYFLRVPKEEAMMLEEFGEQYQQYVSKTGRVIPKRGF